MVCSAFQHPHATANASLWPLVHPFTATSTLMGGGGYTASSLESNVVSKDTLFLSVLRSRPAASGGNLKIFH